MSDGSEQDRRRISDYALIGDCETAALVSRDATIEWLCWPRFDSEACFAALLGSETNGHWRMVCSAQARISRRYLGDSLILETTLETGAGVVRLLDFMPVRGQASDLVRIVIGERGTVSLRSQLKLRFDFGRLKPRWLNDNRQRATAICGPHAARLMSDAPFHCAEDGDCEAQFEIRAGEVRAFVLTYFISHGAEPDVVDPRQALEDTGRYWADWTARCNYSGPWREAVIRSLITMKALTYRPSGSIVAAPSSSLPERPGKGRNWDYRFCWLRDATFTLLAFLNTGYSDEAQAWVDWLMRAVSGDPAHIQPVYGLGGEPRLTEWEAPWLRGFGGAQPVRFGNAAFQQHQFDVCGEVINALHQAHLHGLPCREDGWRLVKAMIEHLETIWGEPDDGIWEARGAPKRFVHSQAMIWAAIDRGVRRAEDGGLEAPLTRWRALRDQIHAEICRRGFQPEMNSFVRDYGSNAVDASLLLLPQIGFLPADDPRILGTIAAIQSRLFHQGFVLRQDEDDGDPAHQSAFLACSFWLADALVMAGRREEAISVFEAVIAVRNDLGLLSEEFDLQTGDLVGNFPQALSHLALVNTAYNLSRPDVGASPPGAATGGSSAAGGAKLQNGDQDAAPT